jgi:hypothetical protein
VKGKPDRREKCAGDRPIQQRVQQKVVKLRCVVKVREVGLLAHVIVGIAVVVALQIVGVLRRENAGVCSETEGQESAVGNVIQCVAPGERPLKLEPVGDASGERGCQTVVVRNAVVADLRDRAEARIERRRGQPDKRTCPQSTKARGAGGWSSGIAIRVQSEIFGGELRGSVIVACNP